MPPALKKAAKPPGTPSRDVPYKRVTALHMRVTRIVRTRVAIDARRGSEGRLTRIPCPPASPCRRSGCDTRAANPGGVASRRAARVALQPCHQRASNAVFHLPVRVLVPCCAECELAEREGLETSLRVENTQLIEISHVQELHGEHFWAESCTSAVRGSFSRLRRKKSRISGQIRRSSDKTDQPMFPSGP